MVTVLNSYYFKYYTWLLFSESFKEATLRFMINGAVKISGGSSRILKNKPLINGGSK